MDTSLLVLGTMIGVPIALFIMFLFYDRKDGFDAAWNPESKKILRELTETMPMVKKPAKAKKPPVAKEEKKDPDPRKVVSYQQTKTKALRTEQESWNLEMKMQKMSEKMQQIYAVQHEMEIRLDTVRAEKTDLAGRLTRTTDELDRTKLVLAKTKDELAETKGSITNLSSKMETKEIERRRLSEASQKMSGNYQMKIEQGAKHNEDLQRKVIGLENAITENERIIEQQIGNIDKTRATHAAEKKLWEKEQTRMTDEVDRTHQILKAIKSEMTRFEEAKGLMQQYKENILVENQELTERYESLETKNAQLVEKCEELEETKKNLLLKSNSLKKVVQELREKSFCGGGGAGDEGKLAAE